MAVQAKTHIKAMRLDIGGHVIHPAMTGLAAHPLSDMNLVVEINKIGQQIDPVPLDRLTRCPAIPYRSQVSCGRRNLAVAGHTRLGGREISERRFIDRVVAIAAVKPERLDMEVMRIGNGLGNGNPYLGDIAGMHIPIEHPADDHQEDNSAQNTGSGKKIYTA